MKYGYATASLLLTLGLLATGCPAEQRRVPPIPSRPEETRSGAAETSGPDAEVQVEVELTEASTLPDYLAFAALHNPGLQAAFQRWKAALEQIAQAEALPDPRFNYKYFIREIETRTGPQRESFSISQTFPWFGKLALREDVAARQAQRQQYGYEKAKRALFFRVTSTYYEFYYLGRAVTLTEENLVLLKTLEEVARTQYQSGTAAHAAVIKFQIEIARLEDQWHSLRQMKGPMLARLNAALNRPSQAELPWPQVQVRQRRQDIDLDIAAVLSRDNPELLELAQLIEKEKGTVKLAQKESYPDITLGAGYIDTGDAINDVSGSGDDPVNVTLSVNVPLWQEKNKAVESQARARHLAALHDYQDRRNHLMEQWQAAVYRVDDSWRKIELYEQVLLPKARQALSVTQQEYATAAVGFLDMIDAIRTLLAFELTLERAKADQGKAQAKLELIAANQG